MRTEDNDRPVYVVLGAAGGLGSALARRLADAGAGLVLGGRREEPLEELAEEVGGIAHPLDGTDFRAVEDLFGAAAELPGDLAGAANCAGSLLLKPAHLTTREELDATLGDNLVTAFAVVRAAAGAMRGGGSVVLVTSAAAEVGLPNHEAIAAAKAGVAGLVRSAAATYAGRGMRVNAVAPGMLESPMTERLLSRSRGREASEKLHPLGRIGRPEEVAAAVAWLLGPDSDWITGQVWGVDGGLAAARTAPR